MKTKYWIIGIALLLAASTAAAFFLSRDSQPADTVQVFSEGKLLYALSLKKDQTVTVETDRGSNTVTVQNGKVAVTEADCPDGYCMARGYCSSGAQIVCLPHRLVLQFAHSGLDGVSG